MAYNLDSGSLQALLNALQVSSGDPASAYEQLRLRLIRFFRWNNCLAAEELADVALDRLAGRLQKESSVIADPARFVLGVARMLVHEYRVREKRETRAHAEFASASIRAATQDGPEEERAASLNQCLGELSPHGRSLMERYYTGDAGERIRNRQRLAAELGLDLNALRNRALRLRRQLETCIEKRLRALGRRDTSTRVNIQ